MISLVDNSKVSATSCDEMLDRTAGLDVDEVSGRASSARIKDSVASFSKGRAVDRS